MEHQSVRIWTVVDLVVCSGFHVRHHSSIDIQTHIQRRAALWFSYSYMAYVNLSCRQKMKDSSFNLTYENFIIDSLAT